MLPFYEEAAKPGTGPEERKWPHQYQFALGHCKDMYNVQTSMLCKKEKNQQNTLLSWVISTQEFSAQNPNTSEWSPATKKVHTAVALLTDA